MQVYNIASNSPDSSTYTKMTGKLHTMTYLVSVPDPKPTPARIAFSIARGELEAIYTPGEVWGRDYDLL